VEEHPFGAVFGVISGAAIVATTNACRAIATKYPKRTVATGGIMAMSYTLKFGSMRAQQRRASIRVR